jgi:hypothetical protein
MVIEVALSRSAIASRCRPRIEGSRASPFLASPKNPAQLTVAPQVDFRPSRLLRRSGIDGCQCAVARDTPVKGAGEHADGAIERSDRPLEVLGPCGANTMPRWPGPEVTVERAA